MIVGMPPIFTVVIHSSGATLDDIVAALEGHTAFTDIASVEVIGNGDRLITGSVLGSGNTAIDTGDASTAASFTINDETGTLRFTADDGGVAGDNIQVIVFVGANSDATNSPGVELVEASGAGNALLTVTLYAEGATLAQIAEAVNGFANSPVEAVVIGDENTLIDSNIPAADNVQERAGADAVAEVTGSGAVTEATGTSQTGGALEWTQTVDGTHTYVVNLNNIDDNDPVFATGTEAIEISLAESTGDITPADTPYTPEVTSFSGTINVDASGDTGDADARTFALSGGVITSTPLLIVDPDTASANIALASAGITTLSTTVESWLSTDTTGMTDTTSVLVDDDTSSNGDSDYGDGIAYHTGTGANGRTITFTLDGVYTEGSFAVFNRQSVPSIERRINDSTVEFLLNGEVVHTGTLNRDDQNSDEVITITPPTTVVFDAVVLTFSANDDDSQHNLREIRINARPTVEATTREIDIAAGTIYTDDGRTITFDAVSDEDITDTSIIIVVDDGDNDDHYVVDVVTELPTDGTDFYVIGSVESAVVSTDPDATDIPGTRAVFRLSSDPDNTIEFTAVLEGTVGNAYRIDVGLTSPDPGVGSSRISSSDSNIVQIDIGDPGVGATLAQIAAAVNGITNSPFTAVVIGDGTTMFDTNVDPADNVLLARGVDVIPAPTRQGNPVEQADGDAQTGGALEWTSFTTDPASIDNDAGVLANAAAADADGDTVVYSLAWSGNAPTDASGTPLNINVYFAIAQTDGNGLSEGDITLRDDALINFETHTSFAITVTAASTSTLDALDSTASARGEIAITRELVITVDNVNEAPLDIILGGNILDVDIDDAAEGSLLIGTLSTLDVDRGDTFTYAVTGADAASFTVNAQGQLLFTGAFADVRDPGATYAITVTTTDAGTDGAPLSYAEDFVIRVAGLSVGDDMYTGTRAIAEELDASSSNLNLGALNDVHGSMAFTLGATTSENNNGLFTITSGDLIYTGSDSGDFEAGDDLTVVIVATRGTATREYTYVFNLENLNDEAPVFAAEDTDNPRTATVPENTQGGTDGTVLLTAVATDADNVDGADPTETIRYSLVSGEMDNDRFIIDPVTGELRFGENQADFESSSSGDFTARVTATSTSTLTDGGATNTVTADYTITLTDVDEIPTAISISRAALVAGSVEVGTLTVRDPDALDSFGADFTFADFNPTVGGADGAMFELYDAGSGVAGLRFRDATGINPLVGGRKAIGDSYEVIITVSDAGSTFSQTLTIAEGSSFVFTDTNSNGMVDGVEVQSFSNFVNGDGDGLLEENADGSSTPVDLGTVDSVNPDATGFALTADTAENDNDEFQISSSGVLQFIGSGSGNFEDGDTKTISISSRETVTLEAGSFTHTVSFASGGQVDAFVNGVDDTDGTFHYTASLIDRGSHGHRVTDLVIYLNDGSGTIYNVGDITIGQTLDVPYIYVAFGDHDGDSTTDDTWQAFEASNLPTDGSTFYVLGRYSDDTGLTLDIPNGAGVMGDVSIDISDVATAAGSVNVQSFDSSGSASDMGVTAVATAIEIAVESYTIRLADINDAPTITVGEAINVIEGDEVILTEAMIVVADEDANDNFEGNAVATMTFTVSDLQNGEIQLNDVASTTFTLGDLRAGNVKFVHDGGEQFEQDDDFKDESDPRATQFALVVNDGDANSAQVTFELVVPLEGEDDYVNDAPGASEINAFTLNEGATLAIAETHLKTPDADDTREGVVYTVVDLAADGELQRADGSEILSGETFTQEQINDGDISYVHNGSETTTDSFTFTVDDGDEDGSGTSTLQRFNIVITPVTDAPTAAPIGTPATPRAQDEYAHDYTGVPIGDGEVGQDAIEEGDIYTLTAVDMGVFDPDTADADVMYAITSLPAATARLEFNSGSSWAAATTSTTFSLTDLLAGNLRIVHLGDEPSGGLLTFTYTVQDATSSPSAAQTVELDVKPINDAPTLLDLGTNRVDPLHTPGTAVATMTTTDEETTDQTDFTYELVVDETTHYRYFNIVGRELVLKTIDELSTSGEGGTALLPRLEGEEYNLRIEVTDQPNVNPPTDGQNAITREFSFTLPVRSFDVDWDISTTGTIDSPDIVEIDLATDSGNSRVVGTFRIDAGSSAHDNDVFAVLVDDEGNEYVDGLSVVQDGTDLAVWRVHLEPNLMAQTLRELAAGDTLNINFGLEIRYTPFGSTDADGFRRSTETFTVEFTGQNDDPVAVDPERLVFENLNQDGVANGDWIFTDPDGEEIIAQGLWASFGSGVTPTATTLVVNPSANNYNALLETPVVGDYGILYIRADNTWRYVRDDDDIQAVPLIGTTETFNIAVADPSGGNSAAAPLVITITINGENDNPHLFVSADSDIVLDDDDTVNLPVAGTIPVTETTSNTGSGDLAGYSNSHLSQGAAQMTSGRWRANDIDISSTIRIFVGATELGVVTETEAVGGTPSGGSARTYNGRYGDITFNTDGTWQYVLTARAETIAAGETPVESFRISLQDEYGAESNVIVLDITVTGTNDAPTALVSGTGEAGDSSTTVANTGTVIESGFRADASATFTIDRNNQGDADYTLTDLDPADPAVEPHVDEDSNDIAGIPVISGVLDARDIDRVGSDGQPFSAADVHTFELLGSGSDTSTRNSAVDLVDSASLENTNPRDYDADTQADVVYTFKGTYGWLEVNRFTGEWVYRLDNDDVDTRELRPSDTEVDVFTIRITDEEGATDTAEVRINVQGQTDQILGISDGYTNPSGSNPNPQDQEDLAAGEEGGTLNNVAGHDARGRFTLNRDYDAYTGDHLRVYHARHAGSENEDGDAASALSSNWAPQWGGAFVSGQYGTFGRHNASGNQWQYRVNDAHTEVEALDVGDTLVEIFEVQYRDGLASAGRSNIITYRVTIEGANDAPTLTIVANDLAVRESGDGTNPETTADLAANGSLSFDDVDGGDTMTNLIVTVSRAATFGASVVRVLVGGEATSNGSGVFGTFTFDRATDGTVTWEYELIDANVASLGAGDMRTDSVWVRISDDGGLHSSVEQITITITGTEDKPVLTGTTTGSVIEAGGVNNAVGGTPTASGNIRFNDQDGDDVNNDFAGSPDIGIEARAGSSGSYASGQGTGASGGRQITGTYGTLHLGADGSWRYVLDNSLTATQALDQDDTETDTFDVRITDSDGIPSDVQTLTITVTGTNDAPVATAVTGSLNEGGTSSGDVITTANNSPVTDVDASASLTVNGVTAGLGNPSGAIGGSGVAGTYGTLTIQSNGSYTYAANNAESLRQGRQVTDTFTYRVTDGFTTDTATITFTVTGVNDAPTASAATASATEGGAAVTGSLIFDDVDDVSGFPDSHGVTHVRLGSGSNVNIPTNGNNQNVTGDYGTLTISRDGSYSYVADNADRLAQGVTATEVFNYRVTDSQNAQVTQTLTITVTGVNDAPVAVADTARVDVETTLTATGSNGVLNNDSDVDGSPTVTGIRVGTSGTTGTVGTNLQGTYGMLNINSDGTYTYDAGDGGSLSTGQEVVDTFTYTISDGITTDTATLTITLVGTNAGPVFTSGTSATVAENTVASSSASSANLIYTAVATDADSDPVTYSIVSVTRVSDSNDVTSQNLFDIVTDDGRLFLRNDVDYDENTAPADGPFYDVVIRASDGSDSVVQTVRIEVTDHTGDNEGAQFTAAGSYTLGAGSVTENDGSGPLVYEVTIRDDNNPLSTAEMTILSNAPTSGTTGIHLSNPNFRIARDGTSNVYQVFLRSGVELDHEASDTETLTITVGDSSGVVTTNVVTITVDDANDPATGAPVITGTAQVGQTLTATMGDIADEDHSGGLPAITYTWSRVGRSDLSFEGDSYTLVAADEGQRLIVTATFTSFGGATESLESVATSAVTLPSLTVDTSATNYDVMGTAVEGDPSLVTGLFAATGEASGAGNEITYAVASAGTYGTLLIDSSTGAWSYLLNSEHSDFGTLNTGSTRTDTIMVSASAADRVTVTEAITITIDGRTNVDGTDAADTAVTGTTADEVIRAGHLDDTITTGGGDDIVIGGYGNDMINLGSGTETIVYRFSSTPDGDTTGTDGGDTVNSFTVGTDRLVFVDTDTNTPLDLAGFILAGQNDEYTANFIGGGNAWTGIIFRFGNPERGDGPDGSAPLVGAAFTINFAASLGVVTLRQALGGQPSDIALFGTSGGVLSDAAYAGLGGLFGAGNFDAIPETLTAPPVLNTAPTIVGGTAARTANSNEEQTAVTTLTARDAPTDTLTWSLADASGLFQIDSSSGAITWRNAPNYEDASSYGNDNDRMFDLTATVTDGEFMVDVAITVALQNVNEAPEITQGAALTVNNYAERQAATQIVTTLAATDPESDAITWSLESGVGDNNLFNIDSGGRIRWNAEPDFEGPMSSNGNNVFTVTATARDRSNANDPDVLTDEIIVTITLTNVDEVPDDDTTNIGAITVSGDGQIREGRTLTAPAASTIDDDDGTATSLTYQWVSITSGGAENNIGGQTSSTLVLTSALATSANLEGRDIAVRVGYTAGGFTLLASAGLLSGALAFVADMEAEGTPTISRTNDADPTGDDINVGDTLTVDTTGLMDDDNTGGQALTFTYQWEFDAEQDNTYENVSGGTNASLETMAAGNYRVAVTTTDIHGQTTVIRSDPETVATAGTPAFFALADVPTAATLAGTNSPDMLNGASLSASQLIQGGGGTDRITSSGYGDIITGGYGADIITLSSANSNAANGGADSIVYRWESASTNSEAIDGGDTITGFERGVDRLVFVDLDDTMEADPDNPGEMRLASAVTDLAGFLRYFKGADNVVNAGAGDDRGQFALTDFNTGTTTWGGILIEFYDSGTVDGRDDSIDAGSSFRINFSERLTLTDVATIFGVNPDPGGIGSVVNLQGTTHELTGLGSYERLTSLFGSTDDFEAIGFATSSADTQAVLNPAYDSSNPSAAPEFLVEYENFIDTPTVGFDIL